MYKAIINGKEIEVELKGDKSFIGGQQYEADIVELGKNRFHILKDDKSFSATIIEVNHEEKTVRVKINHNEYTVLIKDQYDDLLQKLGMDAVAAGHKADIKAPMPGLILSVLVEPGQQIKKGDAILVLEAMKMENILKSPTDGAIKKVAVKKGDKVEKNQVLISYEL